jgi:hypothetical protein
MERLVGVSGSSKEDDLTVETAPFRAHKKPAGQASHCVSLTPPVAMEREIGPLSPSVLSSKSSKPSETDPHSLS